MNKGSYQMNGPDFNQQEQILVNTILKNIDPKNVVYLDMLEKHVALLIEKYEFRTGLDTDKAAANSCSFPY